MNTSQEYNAPANEITALAKLLASRPQLMSEMVEFVSDVLSNTYSSADEIVEAVQTALDVDGEAISGNYSFDDLHITLPDYLYEATGEDMCALLTDTGLNSGDASSFVGYTIGECVSYLLSMDDLDAILSDLEAEARCVVDTDISNDGKIAAEIGRGLARMFSERLQLQGRIPAYQAFVKWVSDAPHT